MELLFIIAAAFALAHSLFDEAFFVHSVFMKAAN